MTDRPETEPTRSPATILWLPFVLIVLVWLPSLWRFSYEWALNPQYYYGWSVPILAGYLLYDRYPEAPSVGKPRFWWPVTILVVVLALLQGPLRLIGEANSTSRTISWLMGGAALGISFAILYLFGGWRWMRCFAVPLLFLLVGIPWPDQLERPLVQGLMRINAEIAAEIVSMSGIPAFAMGNVIEVPTGVLGVNEACSGIRSLQSTFMASIFLAALYRLSGMSYALMILLSAMIAFVCNLIRTTFLTWEGARHGIEATEKWHDTAGFAILGVVLVCLWVISRFLEKKPAIVPSVS